MADPLSSPAPLFSPSNLSPLTSVEPDTPSPRPQLSKPTRRKLKCYVVLPRLPSSVRALYHRAPDYLGDPEFVRSDLDVIVGEYPLDDRSNPSHYFVRFKDGFVRKVSSHTLLAHYGDIVDAYQRKKAQGLLAAADHVQEHSRMTAGVATNTVSRAMNARSSSETNISKCSLFDASHTEENDSSDEVDPLDLVPTHRPARLFAKFMQGKLPFSPKKLRSDRARRGQLISGTADDLGGFDPVDSDTRSSTPMRKRAYSDLADDEESDGASGTEDDLWGRRSACSRKRARLDLADEGLRHQSTAQDTSKKLAKARSTMPRPARGRSRDLNDLNFNLYKDEALRAHRDICAKCHKPPAHEQLATSSVRMRRIQVDGDASNDDEDHTQALGGWIRCLKCSVAVHWGCLAEARRDEILRAARDKDRRRVQGERAGKPPVEILPDRREFGMNQTIEFICGPCMKGGISMTGCLWFV